jgi:hypothetical protein
VKGHRFEIVLAAALLGAYAAFFLWQTPALWRGALTPAEIDVYAAAMERNLAQPPAEKEAFITRLRAWAAGDDGRPVLLLNLMRYRERLGALPADLAPMSTPLEANAHYEGLVAPLALKRGEYPLVGGAAQAESLTPLDPATNRWDRVVVMRAPSRRAFIEFMSDPAYGPTVPYKTAAAELVLIPLDAELAVPDLRFVLGAALLVIYLSIGWLRAARRAAD